MNYRHAFHAGNFADVVKHAVLCRILFYLHEKDSAFRVIDTHAGAGLYDLTSEEAVRGGEWQAGIGRVIDAPFTPRAAPLLKPYLDVVRAYNGGGPLLLYPGSPVIARAMLRPQDHLIACEVQPDARAALIDTLRRDAQARVVDLDGWLALNAFIPPKERRGLVLIDPPFERPDEFAHFATALSGAMRKWPTGIFLAWYPVKDAARADDFVGAVRRAAPHADKVLRIEVEVPGLKETGLRRAGLLAVNPPWTLRTDMSVLLPELCNALAPGGGAVHRVDAAGL